MILKILSIFLWLICTLSTGLSRITLGAHSFDQVINGYLLGYFVVSLYLIFEKIKLIEMIFDVLHPNRKKVTIYIFTFGIVIFLL